ncbi:MAG TPA: hypothetical protein VLE21_06370 [Candidatus Nitrosocosmicus sp.]|nr:hypothetical protein [Candidatus Nitrosocosmicus sp.]
MKLKRNEIVIWRMWKFQRFLILNMIFALGLIMSISFINLGLGLKIIQQQMVQYENGFFHLIGIVQNNENKTIDDIYAIGTLVGIDNSTIANYSNPVEVHPLNPSEMTPYDITIYDKDQNEQIKNHSIVFTFNSSETENIKNLDIHSVNSRSDLLGFYYISGRITNEMDVISNNTLVVATVSDKDQNISGVWKAQAEPYNIPPSATASFTIPITDNTQGLRITNYTLFITTS